MVTKTVFITGASGLVGRALSCLLIERGYNVRGFGLGEQFYRHQRVIAPLLDTGSFSFEIGSILDTMALVMAMRGCQAVMHLAAMSGPKTNIQRLRCFDINVNGTQNVLAAAVTSNIETVVVTSSSAVYGQPHQVPIPESAGTNPLNIYGMTKLAAEEVTRCYAHEHRDMRFTTARLFNVFGEINAGQSAIDTFVSCVLQRVNLEVYGDGKQIRCYTHADDIAGGLAAVLENPAARNRIYNLGNPTQAVSVLDLAYRVIAAVAPNSGLKVEMRPLPENRSGQEVRESVADITLAQAELGYQPRVTLEDGLRRMAQGWGASRSSD